MTNPVTPNIGLNKIDRTSPSTTYFDLEKYIDQNADAVDRFAGETSASINALEKRLDTEERREVVLQPGLHIVNAERSAPFKLSGIKGRTLVNLLGRDGSCDSLSGIASYQTTLAINNSQYTQGVSSLKVTVEQGFYGGSGYFPNIKFQANKKYVLIADARVENAEYARIHVPQVGAIGNSVTSTTFKPSVTRYHFTSDTSANVDLAVKGTGATAYFDAIRVYEISDAEYTAIATMPEEQVAANYPYVDSVTPVRNPYAIRYGENLASGYSPAILHHSGLQSSTPTLISTYEVKFTGETISQNVDKGVYFDVPVLPGQSYTAAVDTLADNAFIRFEYFKDSHSISNSKWVKNPDFFPSNAPATVSTPIGCSLIRVYITNQTTLYWNNGTLINDSLIGGNYHFKNWRLFLGSSDLGFKPREDSILALQTDLYADPLTSANADEVFEKDGQYFKLANWKKVVLDGSLPWAFSTDFAGFKSVRFEHVSDYFGVGRTGISQSLKYDGKVLKETGTTFETLTAHDQYYISVGEGFKRYFVTVADTDSGWGDNYTPTADEIKAYFMGWKMWQGDSNDSNIPYTSGTKRWRSLTSWDEPSILPTTQAPNWTPYQLVYQLATPTVEPIVSEGMLTFHEGDNQIEVGTGMVVRESANPTYTGDTYKSYNINNFNPSAKLQYRTLRMLAVYKNNVKDNWKFERFNPLSDTYGKELASIYSNNFDTTAAYSVTYLMLDTSPIVPFTGSYAANEKAMLQVMTDAVQQNATAVSVLMNKKADKDSPGWITPTLINGWVPYSDGTEYLGYPTLQYRKDSQGLVHLRGLVKKGASSPSILFYLPEGYRPKQTVTSVTICYSGTFPELVTRIRIGTDGAVTYMYGPTLSEPASWVSLNISPFTLD